MHSSSAATTQNQHGLNGTAWRITLATLVLAAPASVWAAPPVPEVLWYQFNESGTSVTNHASAAPAGTTTAAIQGAISQNGAFNAQLRGLVGSGNSSASDYLNTGWATNLSGSWSISFFSKDIGPSTILFYAMGDANANSMRMFTNGVAGPSNWILRGGGMTDVYANGAATVAVHMTTFVYDSVAGEIRSYVDGVLNTTVAQPSLAISGPGPFKFMGYGSNVGAPSGGQYADFRIYSRALPQAEITDIYVYGTNTPQTLTFAPAPTLAVGDTASVSATSAVPNTGNPIVYATSSTACSVTSAGVVVGLQAGTGNCTITATQAADTGYNEGTATLTFSVGMAAQALTFAPQSPSSRALNAGGTFAINPLATSAAPNSGNSITYSSLTPAVCTVAGTTVMVVAPGLCTLAADQAGDLNHAPAPQVTQSVTITSVAAATAIAVPSLSAWGLGLLSLFAAGLGALSRRKRPQA